MTDRMLRCIRPSQAHWQRSLSEDVGFGTRVQTLKKNAGRGAPFVRWYKQIENENSPRNSCRQAVFERFVNDRYDCAVQSWVSRLNRHNLIDCNTIDSFAS